MAVPTAGYFVLWGLWILAFATVLAVSLVPARAVAAGSLGVVIVFWSVASIHDNTHWKAEESFWLQSVTYGAGAIAHTNHALAISDRDPQLAEFHHLEALRQEPYNIYTNIDLGMLYASQQRFDEGLPLLCATAARNPDSAPRRRRSRTWNGSST